MTKQVLDDSTIIEVGRQLQRKKRKLLAFSICIGGVVVLAVSLLFWWSYKEKQRVVLGDYQQRAEMLAHGKTQLLTAWLAEMAEQGGRLINSDVFRLYATDVDRIEGSPSLLLSDMGLEGVDKDSEEGEELFMVAAQLPMMRRLLEEFVSYSGFLSGRVLNRDGETYIATDATVSALTTQQADAARKVLETGEPVYLPFSCSSAGLVIEMLLPILGTAEGDASKPVAVLLLRRLANGKLTEVISNSPIQGQELTVRLLQICDSLMEIVPWTAEGVIPAKGYPAPDSGGALEFAQRTSLNGEEQVFSLSSAVAGTNVQVVVEIDRDKALSSITAYGKRAAVLAAFGVVAALALVGVLWWWSVGRENKRLAYQYCDMAMQIEDQKSFLLSLTGNVSELIGLKDIESGRYVFANRAFGEAVGKDPDTLKGLDDQAVFGFDTAKRLAVSDQQAREKGERVVGDHVIFLQSKKHHFQIVKSLFPQDAEEPWGILSVLRDNTKVLESLERNRRLVRQTVDALVYTVEASDPYLGGHTRLMNAISQELAGRMHLSDEEKATVSAAANLSQIGKMFVDREVLNKPGKLTPEEVRIMQRHVEHARDVLGGIDFELPVVKAVTQIYEALDGSGYPEGLTGEDIITPAKVLSVANGFCALIRPRAYRPAMSVEDALAAMESDTRHYSEHIVSVLREFITSDAGAMVLAEELSDES